MQISWALMFLFNNILSSSNSNFFVPRSHSGDQKGNLVQHPLQLQLQSGKDEDDNKISVWYPWQWDQSTAHWASTGSQVAYFKIKILFSFWISLVLSFSLILHVKSSLTYNKNWAWPLKGYPCLLLSVGTLRHSVFGFVTIFSARFYLC